MWTESNNSPQVPLTHYRRQGEADSTASNSGRGKELYLTANTLKFPVLKSSFWFSALARPKPTVRTERIRVRSLPKTKRTAQRENL